MTRKKPEDLRSHRWLGVSDMRSFGHKSRLRQIGYDAEDWTGKPVIGIMGEYIGDGPPSTPLGEQDAEFWSARPARRRAAPGGCSPAGSTPTAPCAGLASIAARPRA